MGAVACGGSEGLLASASGPWCNASLDHTVAVWDWATGRELRRFTNVTSQYLPLAFHPRQPVLAFAWRYELVVHANVDRGEVLFQRIHFPNGEWLAWNPAEAFYQASLHGQGPARLRLANQLLRLIASDKTSKEIADALGLSRRTVENHRTNRSTKLGLQGSHSLLKFAFENRARLPH